MGVSVLEDVFGEETLAIWHKLLDVCADVHLTEEDDKCTESNQI